MIEYANVSVLRLNFQIARLMICDLGELCEKGVSAPIRVICGSGQNVWSADSYESVFD